MNTQQKELYNRLSRIEGQVSALKRMIEAHDTSDCTKILMQTKAATSGLKRFAEAFSKVYAAQCLTKNTKDSLASELDTIISTAYSLS